VYSAWDREEPGDTERRHFFWTGRRGDMRGMKWITTFGQLYMGLAASRLYGCGKLANPIYRALWERMRPADVHRNLGRSTLALQSPTFPVLICFFFCQFTSGFFNWSIFFLFLFLWFSVLLVCFFETFQKKFKFEQFSEIAKI
jgi:hypothetical protein